MPFIHEDFLLSTKTACKLYHQYAEPSRFSIITANISPRDIAGEPPVQNLFESGSKGSLQMARDARQRRCGKILHRCRLAYKKFLAWAKPFRTCCAIRSITGRIWNESVISASRIA